MTLTAADRARARQLLVHEGASRDQPTECAHAAARIYEKLFRSITPVLGLLGVQALMSRSVKVAQREFPFLGGATSAQALETCLETQAPAVAEAAAITLFATFFALIATLIGERLTVELLHTAWPTVEAKKDTEIDS